MTQQAHTPGPWTAKEIRQGRACIAEIKYTGNHPKNERELYTLLPIDL